MSAAARRPRRARLRASPTPLRARPAAGAVALSESETLTRYEIMDGAPVRGDRIPIKVPLGGLAALTPSMVVANGLLSVRYFLNLVLVDEADRRYFKQQEVVLFRQP